MFRFLVRFLLLVTLLSAGTFFLAQWKLKSELKSFSNQTRAFMDFDYDAASINYKGEIKINNINLFIPNVGVHLEVRELNLFIGNFLQLVKMQLGANSKNLPESAYLNMQDVLLPLDSKLLVQMNKNIETTSYDVLETAFCGPVERFGLDEYAAMGYNLLAFSSEMSYRLDQRDGSVTLAGRFNIEDIYDSEFQLNIGGVLSWYEDFTQQMSGNLSASEAFITPDITKFSVKVKDQGLHLNKAEYCSRQEDSKTDYYSGHVNEVEAKLAAVGMVLPENVKLLYREALQPDSKFEWSIQPKVNFDFKKAPLYEYSQLVESTGLKVTVNNKPVDVMIDGWSFEKFSNVLIQANAIKDKNAKPEAAYQFKIIKQSFQKINPAGIGNYLKYRVKVKRNDGQEFQGRLTKVSRDNIWMLIHSKDGQLSLPVRRSEIERIEVYKEIPDN